MTHYQDDWLTIHGGDCREVLRSLPDESVQMVCTSPPYWSLRDYGVAGQLGLERTPDEYVAAMVDVFREVRRVLRRDGTLWLNLGDSYAGGNQTGRNDGGRPEKDRGWAEYDIKRTKVQRDDGLKPKDLVGIPWRVARALQEPYYTGSIKDERDRIWLAAMLDAEGCLFLHRRKVGQSNGQGYFRKADSYGAGMEVANTSEAIVQRCMAIAGGRGSITRQEKDRRQPLYRWSMRSNECRDVVREVYPHLVAKQHQARLLLGCPSSGPDAEKAHRSLIALHGGGAASIDFPAPASMFEEGWYLRSDVIWRKLNPMPESVTDRPTKSHEYLFLLSRSERYVYDSAAVMERGVPWEGEVGTRNRRSVWTIATQPYPGAHFATFPEALVEPCILAGSRPGDVVLDIFAGTGTVGVVAQRLSRRAVLIDLNRDYLRQCLERNRQAPLGLSA